MQFMLEAMWGWSNAEAIDSDFVHGTRHYGKSNSAELFHSMRRIEDSAFLKLSAAIPTHWMAL